jgi:NAD-dependent dihydropyrimidine dehydrogenase PreA subunit
MSTVDGLAATSPAAYASGDEAQGGGACVERCPARSIEMFPEPN